MATLTLKISEDALLEMAYRNATPELKREMKKGLIAYLKHTLVREKARMKMFAVLEELHNEAEANGLTEDIIAELLTEN